MSDWLLVKGLYPATELSEHAEDVLVLACQEVLTAELYISPPQPPQGQCSIRFRYGEYEWLDKTQFLIIHKPSGMFWSLDWSDRPSSVAMLSEHALWQGSWMAYGWNKVRFYDWAIPEARHSKIWPGFNSGFFPNRLVFAVPQPTSPFLLFRDGYMRPGQELLRHLSSDVLRYSEHITGWPDTARAYGMRLCIPGVALWAKRDADCWASGIPTLVLNHGGRLAGEPEPGKCWLAIDVPCDRYGHPNDPVVAAENIRRAWQEARNDTERVRQYAVEAKKYYDAYGEPKAVARRIADHVIQAVRCS